VEDDSQLPQLDNKKPWLLAGAGLLLFLVVIGVIIGVIVWQTLRDGEEQIGNQTSKDWNSSSQGCIPDRDSLISAVDKYLANNSNATDVAIKYGWPIGTWCVSPVTDFRGIFDSTRSNATSMAITNFNEPLNEWDVSKGGNFVRMFYEAGRFNQDLSQWNMSRANDIFLMFYGASKFNQNLYSWDVSSVTSMARMFEQASVFNGDISTWDVSRVTDMSSMFSNAAAFNSNISSWQVWNVGYMESMFETTEAFNQDISGWETLNLISTKAMFQGARNFNQDISNWTVSSVEIAESMFQNAIAFNQHISRWNLSSVTSMESMFAGASSFNQNLCTWSSYQFMGSAETDDIFARTNCTDPIVNLTQQPFSVCQPCVWDVKGHCLLEKSVLCIVI